MTDITSTPKSIEAQKRSQAWQALRCVFKSETTIRLQFTQANSPGWLMARYRGIPCYLLKKEIGEMTLELGCAEFTVKIVWTSRKSRSALVTTRVADSLDLLQQEAVRRQVSSARRKAGLVRQAENEKGAWAEFSRLKENETVTGTVLRSHKIQPKRGRAQLLYFVKIGEHLVGALSEQRLPFVDGGKVRRSLVRGEIIELRVQRKYVNSRTGKSVPKVDLAMALATEED